MAKGKLNRCRWNPIPGSQIIAMKHELDNLNLFDAEKQKLVYQNTIKVEKSSYCEENFL